jgi:hypothetical protein
MRSRLSPKRGLASAGSLSPSPAGGQRQDPASFPRRAAGRESGAEAGGSGLHGQFFSVVLIHHTHARTFTLRTDSGQFFRENISLIAKKNQLEDCKEFRRMIQDKDNNKN